MKKIYVTNMICLLMLLLACSKDKEIEIVPEEPKPIVDFTYLQATADDAFTIAFESTIQNGKKIRWEFGDDSVSTEAAPTHTFMAADTYRVLLTVENNEGYKAQKEVFLKLDADVILNIAATPLSGRNVRLSVMSSTAYSDLQWTIEGGVSSTEATPVTNVPLGTVKKVTLTAKTDKGSVVVINRLVTSSGVAQDVTQGAALEVSRDNYAGPTSGEGSLKLIDNDPESKWLVTEFETEYAQQRLTTPQIVTLYSLTSGNDESERDPKNWTLEGSNDDVNWDILDVRQNESFGRRTETRLFTINNDKMYLYYRWNIQSNNGDGLFQIGEWRLYITK